MARYLPKDWQTVKWTQASKYHVTSGEWTISKANVGELVKYTLWHSSKIVGVFDSLIEAKKWDKNKEKNN